MGKVYDALRKAEAQRAQGAAARSGLPLPGERSGELPGERPRPAPRDATGIVSRVRGLLQGGTPARPASEATAAINKRRIALLHPDSFVAEQFRALRAQLDSLAAQRPLRSIALTSALPDEGKTTAAVNLALVTAMGVERRVLLIDCDLRRPKIHSSLGLRPEVGLAEVLTGQTTLERAIVKVDGTSLDALPVRGTPANPSELLASAQMRKLLEEASQRYDLVILDTPPALSLPDAKILTEIADGFLLVVRADSTPQDDVEAALDVLNRRRALGVVLNGVTMDERRYGY